MALQISAEFPGLISLTVPVVLVNRFSSDYYYYYYYSTRLLSPMQEVAANTHGNII